MVIARLTQLRMAIPASGHAPGEVPVDCFPKLTNVPNTPDRKRVSFATIDEAVEVPSGTAPTEQIGTLSTTDNGQDAHAKSPGTPPGFRPFEWPQAEWDSNGDLQLDPGLPFVASWSARIAEEAMLSPPPLEPMSPIPNMDSQDSMLVQTSTAEMDAETPVVLKQIRLVCRQRTREASSPRTRSGSSVSTAEFLFKDILCAEALIRQQVGSVKLTKRVPRWRLAREGPFPNERSQASLRVLGKGCLFRHTSYNWNDHAPQRVVSACR